MNELLLTLYCFWKIRFCCLIRPFFHRIKLAKLINHSHRHHFNNNRIYIKLLYELFHLLIFLKIFKQHLKGSKKLA